MTNLVKILFRVYTLISKTKEKHRLLYYKHLYGKNIEIGKGIKFGKSSVITIFPGGFSASVYIGNNVIFRQGCYISLDQEGYLNIGDNSFFNNSCSINCLGRIEIGRDTLFGENVRLYDHNHNYKDMSKLVNEQGFSVGSIKIGNNCWIGSNCVILNNVEIGDNVIIGANNLIYKSIPSGVIVKKLVNYTTVERY